MNGTETQARPGMTKDNDGFGTPVWGGRRRRLPWVAFTGWFRINMWYATPRSDPGAFMDRSSERRHAMRKQ